MSGVTSGPRLWRWEDSLEPLTRAVGQGAIIALPTESSYALAVEPRSQAGVASIFHLKGRPGASPLPVVAANRTQMERLGCRFDDPRLDKLSEMWPAPLSLLVPLKSGLPAAAGSGRLAVRIPAHEKLRRLLETLGTPLTATSANRSGQPPLNEAGEVLALLAEHEDAIVIDDGVLAGGNPSTLIGVRGGEIEVLRRGALPTKTIAAHLGVAPEIFSAAAVEILADEPR